MSLYIRFNHDGLVIKGNKVLFAYTFLRGKAFN